MVEGDGHQVLIELDGSTIREINGKSYVPAGQEGKLVTERRFVPLFFARTVRKQILHDSPSIGAWEYGNSSSRIHGPFRRECDAEAAVAKESGEIDHVGCEFSSEMLYRMFPAGQAPPDFIRYSCSWLVMGDIPTPHCVMFGTKALAKLMEEIEDFTGTVIGDLESHASDKRKTDSGGLLAVVDNILVEIKYKEHRPGSNKHLSVSTLYRGKDTVLDRILSAFFGRALPTYAYQKGPSVDYLVEAPGPALSVAEGSIDAFVKKHGFMT